MILSDECGHLLAARNRAVVIRRCTTTEVGGGGGLLPYMSFVGMYRCEGYSFPS